MEFVFRLLSKIVGSILILVVSASFLFIIIESGPGEPIDSIAPASMDAEEKRNLAKSYGYDGSALSRYKNWILNLFKADLGVSMVLKKGEKVEILLLAALEKSLQLILISAMLAVISCLFLSFFENAFKKARLLNKFKYLSSIPLFVAGYLTISIINYAAGNFFPPELKEGWFPLGSNSDFHPFTVFCAAIALGLFNAHLIDGIILIKQNLNKIQKLDYVKNLRLGMKSVWPFYLRSSMAILVDYLSSVIPRFFGILVIVEIIFSLQGLGKLAWDAAISNDNMVLIGVSLASTVMILAFQIMSDLAIFFLDPRRRS